MNTPTTVAVRSEAHTYGAPRVRRVRSQIIAQSGVGLIEVLVAVLVLSIAFLGIAALQAMSMSTNNSAMARSMATISSYSILDAMRADIAVANAGGYNTPIAAPIKASACPDVSAGTLASYQLNQWCTQFGKSLGAVATTTGAIVCTAAGATAAATDCTVIITFDDSRAGVGGASVQTVTTRAML